MPDDSVAAQQSGSGTQAPGSTPGNNAPKNAGSQVEAPQNQSGGGLPAGARREFFTLREKVREKNTEVEQLRAELDALKAPRPAVSGNPGKVDPLEDPDGYREALRRDAREEARRELDDVF